MNASYYREQARRILSGNWGKALLVSFVACIFGGLLIGVNLSLNINTELLNYLPKIVVTYLKTVAKISTTLSIVQFIIGGAVQLGYCQYLLNLYDGKPAGIQDLFSQFDRLLDGLLLVLLRYIYTFLWTLLFFIPGIIAAMKYAMAPFILLENPGMSANTAISESKEMMYGHKWELFCLQMSYFGWLLLSVLTLNIGSLWLNPYMNASFAAFYRSLVPRAGAEPEQEVPYV